MSLVRLGSRGSALALWQAERVRSLLAARGISSEITVIRTSGDEGSARPAAYVEGKGLFTRELEDALLDGRIDAAVHSAKDLGALVPGGLVLAAFPEREDARDAVVSRAGSGLAGLGAGMRIGTASLRRISALRAERPDLAIVPIRGNVPTRLARIEKGEVDAVMLAMAGLKRLDLAAHAVPLDPSVFVPAPAQGALAIETREDDAATRGAIAQLDDAKTRISVEAERAAMAELEGGCRVPLGITTLGEPGAQYLLLRVYATDGTRTLTAKAELDPRDPRGSGLKAARELLAKGARDLIADQRLEAMEEK